MLFRLTHNPNADKSSDIIGHAWLDVLAIAPYAIQRELDGYGPWCLAPLAMQWYCITPCGLAAIAEDDISIVGFRDAPDDAEYVISPATTAGEEE